MKTKIIDFFVWTFLIIIPTLAFCVVMWLVNVWLTIKVAQYLHWIR